MIIVIFRIHVHPEANLEELGAVYQKMVALSSEMPGVVSVKDYSAKDGEMLVLGEFDSLEAVDAWRTHPEHLMAQPRGQEAFFADYRIQVCSPVRTNEWTKPGQ